jgi:hypothetical protein
MVHCGYEGAAAEDALRNPLKAFLVSLRGVRTEGEMAPEIPLDGQRPAEYRSPVPVSCAPESSDAPGAARPSQRPTPTEGLAEAEAAQHKALGN